MIFNPTLTAPALSAPLSRYVDGSQVVVSVDATGAGLRLDDTTMVSLAAIRLAPLQPNRYRLFAVNQWRHPMKRLNLRDTDNKSLLEQLIHDQELHLRFSHRSDRYRRQPAIVEYDHTSIQETLVSQGRAYVYLDFDHAMTDVLIQLYKAEHAARESNIGHWRDDFKVITVDTAQSTLSTFQIVEGIVLSTKQVGKNIYLNFGPDWQDDFTVMVKKENFSRFKSCDLKSMIGRLVRVRGWIKDYNGPLIEASYPAQIEPLTPPVSNHPPPTINHALGRGAPRLQPSAACPWF